MTDDTPDKKLTALDMTRDIVAAYVGRNDVQPGDLPGIIRNVFEAVDKIVHPENDIKRPAANPAVPIENSVTDDFIICLEDGKPFKSLKRHLRTKFDLSPEAYREKWGLPVDYPMVAPAYAQERSKLAKKMGLGRSEA